MDFNLFECGSRFVDRVSEAAVDFEISSIPDDGQPDSPKVKRANQNGYEILNKADNALAHGDKEEASHQLKREVFFSEKTMQPGNRYEKAAHAGLEALKQGSSTEDVSWRMEEAFLQLDKPEIVDRSKQIPTNPEFSSNFSAKNRGLATGYCREILGRIVPHELKHGHTDEALGNLRRSIYLADKYIPNSVGVKRGYDPYESAAREALRRINQGELRTRIMEPLKPLVEEYRQKNGGKD